MTQVKRPIGPADMEFYHAPIVRKMALVLSGYTEEEWDAVTSRTRSNWLDRAAKASCDLMNDAGVATSAYNLLKGRI